MTGENEKRAYIRDNCDEESFIGSKISTDGRNWTDVKVYDFSAGGIKFCLEKDSTYKVGDVLNFELVVDEFPTQVKIRSKIKIRRTEHHRDGQVSYGASFVELNPNMRIRIDEVILYKKRQGGQDRSANMM
ncbi:MAG: PilZ domain-containing protein [Oscillospiraceae bacterium]|jgi:c-di-GMP-binding flagellar brake protein YcgR|nr:PilZ domain-containing protein [Oscillospiraceae bacterium]